MSFERKLNNDGSINPKYVDLLEEDRPIANQKFTCVSFISPENIIKDKNLFFFQEFLKDWDFTKSVEKYTQFLNFISFKYNIKFDDLTSDLQEFIKSEKDKLQDTSIQDDFKNFVDSHEEELDNKFNETVDFQTTTRGLKIRGVYPTQEEAEMRCKLLREVDPNHDVYVGPVGMWMPWEPEAYKTSRVEYLEEELNQLMQEKKKNEDKAKQEFDKRIRETKEKAIQENMRKAKETGNKLTQNIDNNGNLYSVNCDTGEDNEVLVPDIKKELFESDDVVMGKSDHGLSKLSLVQDNEIQNTTSESSENLSFNIKDVENSNLMSDSSKSDKISSESEEDEKQTTIVEEDTIQK
jgi:hypothetical protein